MTAIGRRLCVCDSATVRSQLNTFFIAGDITLLGATVSERPLTMETLLMAYPCVACTASQCIPVLSKPNESVAGMMMQLCTFSVF